MGSVEQLLAAFPAGQPAARRKSLRSVISLSANSTITPGHVMRTSPPVAIAVDIKLFSAIVAARTMEVEKHFWRSSELSSLRVSGAARWLGVCNALWISGD